MTQPKRIAITGAAGQICYSMLFRIAAGDIYGPDQPVSLHLLEITPALGMLEAVKMELDDCAFPLLNDVIVTDDAKVALNKVDAALFVGAKPRCVLSATPPIPTPTFSRPMRRTSTRAT